MMTDRILSQSSFSHVVDVPIERIDMPIGFSTAGGGIPTLLPARSHRDRCNVYGQRPTDGRPSFPHRRYGQRAFGLIRLRN
jgi:hypothetical protein